MRNALIALLVPGAALSGCSRGSAHDVTTARANYAVVGSIAGPAGSYDYAAFDASSHRLFVGRSYGVMRVDVDTGKASTLLARKGVAAVLPIAGTRLMLSTNGDSDTATLFDRDTGAVAADLPTGHGPDGAWYEQPSGLAFVMNGESEDATVVDVAARKVVATIKLPGKPEAATSIGKGRLFVNIENLNAVAVIDIARRQVTGSYTLADCKEPTAIAYDATTGLLMSACHNGFVRLIDAASGADKGKVTIGQGADGLLFDPASRTGFASCIDGTLTIFALDPAGRTRTLQRLRTRAGARTLAYDPARDRVYLPAATIERDAEGEYVRADKNFAVVVVARKT